MNNNVTSTQNIEPSWKTLFRVGGASAIAMAVLIPIQSAIFLISPPPTTVEGAFALFQANKIMGLLDYDLMLGIDYLFMILLFLALYFALRKVSPSLMAIGVTFGIIGIGIWFSSNPAFQLLNLSDQYYAAATEAQKSIILAAGQAQLVNFTGSSFNVSYIMGGIALLFITIVMLRSGIFGRKTAILGMVMSAMMFIPPTVPVIGIYFSMLSLIPTFVWLILIARRLFKM
jgi:hypothetical protein